jgi:hypothetical protein
MTKKKLPSNQIHPGPLLTFAKNRSDVDSLLENSSIGKHLSSMVWIEKQLQYETETDSQTDKMHPVAFSLMENALNVLIQ